MEHIILDRMEKNVCFFPVFLVILELSLYLKHGSAFTTEGWQYKVSVGVPLFPFKLQADGKHENVCEIGI